VTAPRWAAFVILAVAIAVALFDIDHALARFAASASPALLRVFRVITWFGQGGVVLVPSGIALLACLWLRPRLPSLADALGKIIRGAGLLFAAVAAAGITNDGLKLLFERARPRLWLHGDPTGFFSGHMGSDYQSFPSGHTATSVAAAIVLSQLFPRWRAEFALFALLIAFSRILLDAHYLSDVIAGAAVGTICATLAFAWFRRHGWIVAPTARLR
jgi:undecaprenyl-diphosphatase